MPDHIHIFIWMRPHQSISALIQNVKTESSKWINTNKCCKNSFRWQEGYGAFSYSKSHVQDVVRYIQNQELYHRKETFLEEYKRCWSCLRWTLMNSIFLENLKVKRVDSHVINVRRNILSEDSISAIVMRSGWTFCASSQTQSVPMERNFILQSFSTYKMFLRNMLKIQISRINPININPLTTIWS